MRLIHNLRLRSHGATDKLREYRLCFGRVRGIGWCTAAVVVPRLRGRAVAVGIPSSSAAVLVRLGTTDIAVFNTTFKTEQYGFDLPSEPSVIVDAGAYTGLSSVYFSLRYPDATIIALEPSPSNFELLRRNTQHLTNIVAVQAALWTRDEPLILADPREGDWAFRVKSVEIADQPASRSVRAMTIHDIIREFGIDNIGLLKLDIEGSELDLFTEPHGWLSEVEAIFAELHDRFRPGCARAFFTAVEEFPVEAWRGEAVMVARSPSADLSDSRLGTG